jgi:glycosyltransferase involved in cell wall biosynthesis
VPFSISVPDRPPLGVRRGYFGLPADAFVFLFAFDCHSLLERKNPLAVVRAFREAFGLRPGVQLVLKAMHAAPASPEYRELARACAGQGNIRLLDAVMSRAEMHALMLCCDAYVSLHRSEGFGLTVAEAMAMGKAVLATAWSANADFMTARNSCPIPYRLVPLQRDHGPYRAGGLWADPLHGSAVEAMRRVALTPGLARRLGEAARADVRRHLSPQRVGQLIYSRLLSALARLRGGEAPAGRLPAGDGVRAERQLAGVVLHARPAERQAA